MRTVFIVLCIVWSVTPGFSKNGRQPQPAWGSGIQSQTGSTEKFAFSANFHEVSEKKGSDYDPYYKSFYETARLIMTKEESHIYKHLPDNKSREEFIEDFWKKRDPNPDSDENEIKEEFEERITYANRWFREGRGKDRGWDTQRGRILLQLGFPEERHWGVLPNVDAYGHLKTTKRLPMEVWYYFRYRLVLIFTGDFEGANVFKLLPIPSNLMRLHEALEQAKFRLDIGMHKPRMNEFRFEADYKKDGIVIEIPVKRTSFEKRKGEMRSEFAVEISVFKEYRKVETVRVNKTVRKDEKELLEAKNIDFFVPYTPGGKGSYFFDIIIEDKSSSSKYRDCFTHKFRANN